MKEIKVYGMTTIARPEWRERLGEPLHVQQCRMFTAARSVAEALRAFSAASGGKVTRGHWDHSGAETANDLECLLALKYPDSVWVSNNNRLQAVLRVDNG